MQEKGPHESRPERPEPQEVRGELARVLTSPDFNVPERLRGFLTFVIEETLAGRGDRIKAYSIATHVFGRAQDFDVQNDPVVRIEAGRLRRALERYYLTGGRTDPIVLDIPKGGYAPEIRRRGEAAEDPAADERAGSLQESTARYQSRSLERPFRSRAPALAAGIAVIFALSLAWTFIERNANGPEEAEDPEVTVMVSPFANLSGPDSAIYSAGISDELLSQLARFRELRVIGRDTARLVQPGGQAARQAAGMHYLLEGSVRTAGQHLRVSSRLVDGRTAEILWSQVYDRDLRATGSFEIESDIAAKVATAVAEPYGAIFTPVSRDASARVPGYAEAYLCVLRFYQYRKVLNREEHGATRDCMEKTTARSPDYSTGWAMLAYLYLDEDRFGLNRRSNAAPGRARAREAAERAIRLDPSNVRGLQALMTVLFFSNEPERALQIGERALALNPNDSEMLAELGSRIAQAGDWRRGASMIEDALARSPAQSGYYVGLLALAYYMLGDDRRAAELIKRADLAHFSIYHFAAALIFSRAGLEQDAKASVRTFLALRPRFFDDFEAELAMRNFNARDRLALIEGARQAGFPVKLATR